MSMAHDPDDTLLTIKEVAALVRAPEGTVRYWRFMGTGPRSIKVGKRVCFWKSDVLKWLEDLGGWGACPNVRSSQEGALLRVTRPTPRSAS